MIHSGSFSSLKKFAGYSLCFAVALLSPQRLLAQTTVTGSFETIDGQHFWYAVNGGGVGAPPYWGLGAAALDTNRTTASSWEQFTVVPLDNAQFELQTSGGEWVTAVNGGGMGGPNDATSPIHTDATQTGVNTTFVLTTFPNGLSTIQTCDGYYVTANNSGGITNGQNTVPFHTDAPIARAAGPWEKFTLVPSSCPQPTTYSNISFTIATADNSGGARQDSAVVATLNVPGQTAPTYFCLKPSSVADEVWNGQTACPQNPNAPTWGPWQVPLNNQSFTLSPNVTLGPGQTNFGTMSIALVEHPRGLEDWDNSYIQGIQVTGTSNTGANTLLFSEGSLNAFPPVQYAGGPIVGSGCLLELTHSNNTFTFLLMTGSTPTNKYPSNSC